MRPSLTIILVMLAIVVSVAVGLISGGGWRVWLTQPVVNTGPNENITLPLTPATPTPFAGGAEAAPAEGD